MESWDVRSLEIEPHHPQVLSSDDETRLSPDVAALLPPGAIVALSTSNLRIER